MAVNFFLISRRIILLYYYRNIHLNPNYWYKLLYLYRFMLGFLIVCSTIRDNPMYIYGLLYELNINYFNDLFFDSIHENMVPWGWGNNGEGSSRNVPMGTNPNGPSGPIGPSGPSGPSGPGGNNPLGVESGIENENSKNRDYEFKMKYRRKPDAHTPAYRYYDKDKHRWVYPETFHEANPTVLASKTMRIYEEGGIRWTYMCSDFYEECRYCVVTYPDGTRAYIFDKPTLMKHIEFHKRHVAMNYQADPPFIYEKYYKEHFDEFRQEKIRREFLAKQTNKKELFID